MTEDGSTSKDPAQFIGNMAACLKRPDGTSLNLLMQEAEGHDALDCKPAQECCLASAGQHKVLIGQFCRFVCSVCQVRHVCLSCQSFMLAEA